MPKQVRHDGNTFDLTGWCGTVDSDYFATSTTTRTPMRKGGCVYIMSNYERTTLYIGVTNNLERRVLEHKAGRGSEFTHRYALTHLLYFEEFPDITAAIRREKQLKNWHRDWKLNLIREQNPTFADLAREWYTPNDVAQARELPT
jgi:putative endonuclease